MHADGDPRIERIEADLSALKTSTSFGFGTLSERLDGLRDVMNSFASRPPAGVPVWVVLVAVAPATILAGATLLMALFLMGS